FRFARQGCDDCGHDCRRALPDVGRRSWSVDPGDGSGEAGLLLISHVAVAVAAGPHPVLTGRSGRKVLAVRGVGRCFETLSTHARWLSSADRRSRLTWHARTRSVAGRYPPLSQRFALSRLSPSRGLATERICAWQLSGSARGCRSNECKGKGPYCTECATSTDLAVGSAGFGACTEGEPSGRGAAHVESAVATNAIRTFPEATSRGPERQWPRVRR